MDEYLKTEVKALIRQNKVISIEARKEHNFTIIWLHGYGDTNLGFYEIFSDNVNPFGDRTKIVLPCAPLLKTKALPAFLMNSWFDLEHLSAQDIRANFDDNGIAQAVEFINALIEHEAQFLNYQYERIFLGGFSQGFMLALKAGLENTKKLGGVLGFCGINFAFQDKHKDRLPLFIGLSKNDSVINYSLATDSFENLEACRKEYNFMLYIDYTSGHTISFAGFKKLETFFAGLQSRYVTQS